VLFYFILKYISGGRGVVRRSVVAGIENLSCFSGRCFGLALLLLLRLVRVGPILVCLLAVQEMAAGAAALLREEEEEEEEGE
jgi:hypothetical protein